MSGLPLHEGHARRYFNNCGASLMPQAVIDAITTHLAREAAIGAYGAAAEVAGELADLHAAAGELLGCDADEIALTDSNSRAWGAAFSAMRFQAGDRILVGRNEWGGNYATLWQLARESGVVIETIPANEHGEVDLPALAAMLETPARLVCLTWVPSNGGLIQPAAEVGALTRAAGVTFLLDAAQAVGQLPVDVKALGCDILTAAGRKWLRGPRGTGLLYVRRGLIDSLVPRTFDHVSAPWHDGDLHIRPDARRFETSETSIALRLGLRVAIRHALDQGLPQIAQRIGQLAGGLRAALAAIDGVQLQDLGRHQSGLVTFTVRGLAPAEVQRLLAADGFTLTVNSAPFTPLDMAARGLGSVVRAAPHVYNTEEEIAELAQAVARIAARG